MNNHLNFNTTGLIVIGLISCTKENKIPVPAPSPDPRPNILIISCEDLSPRLHCYGDSLGRTPHLDRLAAMGTIYNRAYATTPVSAPSRSSIITGMYACSYGAQNMRTNNKSSVVGALDSLRYKDYFDLPLYDAIPPADVRCFSELMRQQGYYCTNNSKTDYNFAPPVTSWDENSKHAHWRNRPAGKPFFAVFNIMATHESQIWKQSNDTLITDPNSVTVPPFYPDTKKIRTDIARIYDNMSRMDSAVGRILQMLEEDSLTKNTIIMFYSDHGDGLPRYKRSIYETGLQVAFIIAKPENSDDGKRSNRLVSLIDVGPTVLTWAGIPVPDYMHGIPISDTVPAREYCYATADRMDVAIDCSRSVCDSQYRYIRNYMPAVPFVQDIPYRNQMATMQELYAFQKAGKFNGLQRQWFAKTKPKEELYDIINDPYNLRNLAELPAYKKVLDRMRNAHETWRNDVGDLSIVTEKEMIKQLWGGNTQPQTLLPAVTLQNTGTDSILIGLTCATAGASIGYRFRSEGHSWNIYNTPFIAHAKAEDTLEVVAHRIGYKPSQPLTIYVKP